MKFYSLIGSLFVVLFLVAVPVTAKDTPAGWRLSIDTAQAYVTYRRAQVATRRAVRRDYRYTRRAIRYGY